jgi:hypothetical protein
VIESVYPESGMNSLNLPVYASIFHLPWKYQSDLRVMSMVVASFSKQKINVNSSVNFVQDAKTLL